MNVILDADAPAGNEDIDDIPVDNLGVRRGAESTEEHGDEVDSWLDGDHLTCG